MIEPNEGDMLASLDAGCKVLVDGVYAVALMPLLYSMRRREESLSRPQLAKLLRAAKWSPAPIVIDGERRCVWVKTTAK